MNAILDNKNSLFVGQDDNFVAVRTYIFMYEFSIDL